MFTIGHRVSYQIDLRDKIVYTAIFLETLTKAMYEIFSFYGMLAFTFPFKICITPSNEV